MTIEHRPDWVPDAVFYQIFPDRFAKSATLPKPSGLEAWDAPPTVHGYKGGDLVGIAEHLDWIVDLGVDAILLNPITTSPSNHRYHASDYFEVDPLLGGNQAFEHLIAACHERGVRVVVDGVFNHTGRAFHQFADIVENGAGSPYLDWYHVDELPLNAFDEDAPPNYAAWWGLHALPKLNHANPDVREHLMQAAEHWIRRGAAGWRLDVAEEITEPGFWEEFRKRVRAVDPDAYIVGEIWTPAGDWVGDAPRFDAVMNYVFMQAVLQFVAGDRIDQEVVSRMSMSLKPRIDASGYRSAVDLLMEIYPGAILEQQFNLLGSHDTPRLLSTVSGDVDSVVLAYTLLMTFLGPPCVYYGDEIGMEGGHDPGSRGGFPWERSDEWNKTIYQSVRELIDLRRREVALRRGTYRHLHSEGDVYAFERVHDDGTIVVAVNASTGSARLDLGVADRLWGETTPIEGVVELPPRSAGIWRGA